MPRPSAFARLVALSARADRALHELDAVPRRDPLTGAFTARGTVTPRTLRKAWSGPRVLPDRPAPAPESDAPTPQPRDRREAFRASLAAALRSSRRR
jgi:hypothetical protein